MPSPVAPPGTAQARVHDRRVPHPPAYNAGEPAGSHRMRHLDFSSWETVLSTIAGIVLITLVGVGIRLLVMQRVQQRRERQNRQINERL